MNKIDELIKQVQRNELIADVVSYGLERPIANGLTNEELSEFKGKFLQLKFASDLMNIAPKYDGDL